MYLVLGHGEVGVTIACRLQSRGFPSVFLGRKIVDDSDSARLQAWGRTITIKIHALSRVNLSSVIATFVALPAYDLTGALDRYMAYIPKSIPMIIMVNGYAEDQVAAASQKYPDRVWRLGYHAFDTLHISESIYSLPLATRGIFIGPFVPTERNRVSTSAAEQNLLEKDPQFFKYSDLVLYETRRRWLYELVINSISAADDLPTIGALLNDSAKLKTVAEEGYGLGFELFGHWDRHFDKLFQDLISYISCKATIESQMHRQLRLGERTENAFYAKLAIEKRGYKTLMQLCETIDKKEVGRRLALKPAR